MYNDDDDVLSGIFMAVVALAGMMSVPTIAIIFASIALEMSLKAIYVMIAVVLAVVVIISLWLKKKNTDSNKKLWVYVWLTLPVVIALFMLVIKTGDLRLM